MDYKKALENICNKCDEQCPFIRNGDWCRAMGDIRSAVEKQIPKKPLITNQGTVTRCPNCNAVHFQLISFLKVDYCRRCGQAIDWVDEE